GNPSVDVVTPTPTTAEGGLSTGIKKLKVLPAPLAQRDSAFDMPSVTNVAPVAQDTHAKASFYGDLIDYTDDELYPAAARMLESAAVRNNGAGPIRGDYTAHGGHRSGGRALLSIHKEARQSTLPHRFIFVAFTQTHNRLFGTTGFRVTKDADHHGAIVNLTRSDEVFAMGGPRDQLHAMIDGVLGENDGQHMIGILKMRKKWVYEDDGKEAHRSFIRVAREAGSGPLNLGHEIQKRAAVNQLSGDLVKRLLTFQVEAASSEQVPFVLIAAVCYRNESTPVRIRLFTCRGVEFPPHYEATYNGSDWEIGAVGHTYFMLHVQSNIQVTKITPHMHNIITGRVSGTHEHVVGDEKRHRLPRNEEDHLVVAERRRAE
ncbi:uncharacterized protein CLUP02_17338, partial [Colletotrichum lupini]